MKVTTAEQANELFPDIARICRELRAQGATVKWIAAVNDAGDEMGAVDDRLRNLATTFDAAQAGRVFHAPPTPRAVAAAAKARNGRRG